MIASIDILVMVKYVAAVAILIMLVLAPSWLATQTKKDKTSMTAIRIMSWLLCWTGIGWLVALFWAIRK